MRKGSRNIFLILILVLSTLPLSFTPSVSSFEFSSDLVYVYTEGFSSLWDVNFGSTSIIDESVRVQSSEAEYVTSANNQRKLVRIDDGTLYCVYPRKIGGLYAIFVQKSVDDGVTWSGDVKISTFSGMTSYNQAYPSIAIDSNNYLHVVWSGKATGFTAATQIWHRIYWLGSWSLIQRVSTLPGMGSSAMHQEKPSIFVDSQDNIHVMWKGSTPSISADVWYNNCTAMPDLEWGTVIQISTDAEMEGRIQLYPTIAIDSNDVIHSAWTGYTDSHPTKGQIWYRNATDGSWGAFTRISTFSGMNNYGQQAPCVVTDFYGYIQIGWLGKATGFTTDEQIWVNNYSDSWSGPTRISTYAGMEDYDQGRGGFTYAGPTLAVDSNNYLHVLWDGKATGYTDQDKIWHANYTSSWFTPECLQTSGRNRHPNLLLGEVEARYIWAANVTFPEVGGPDDFDWGSGFGDSAFWYTDNAWVFEGKKRYEFNIAYSNYTLNPIQQFGIRFTDSRNQVHIIWYDKDANTLTVTSPEDGISGWLSSIEKAGTSVTAIFQIMFNKPIPDSYAVQLQLRVITDADSGWLTPDGGIFNIYNLGGLATLYDEGMAGRVLGGDIFEIYAADTRTPILVPPYGFDVRENPINWWEWGQSEEDLLDDVDWMLWMPIREPGLTMYPTNRLPSGAAQDKRAYTSYPFGLRIMDNQTDANRNMYMEKNFWRVIDASDEELVFTQFHMMNPDVGEYGNPGGGGEIRVMDRSIKQEGFAWMALQLRFDAIGNMTAYNDTASAWVKVMTVVDYQWYNVTGIFNLTTQMVDIYIDDVLKLDDLPFVSSECGSLKTLWVGRANAVVIRNDFYVDDVHAWTDWDKDYGGISEATMLFDMNQHWSMDFDFFIEDGQVHGQGASGAAVGQYVFAQDYSDHGYWEFGWDVMINNTLVHDFLVASVNVSDGRIGSRDNWIKYNVSWYSQGDYIKSDLLYGIFEGYSIFPGSDKDTSGWHWDIWFNRANASTIVGARLNTEYYGMSDKSVWWAVWSSLWKPMRTEVSESSLFVDLEDSGGTIHSAQDVSFVRSWVQVLRTNEAEFAYKIVNTGSLDFMVATDIMSGIDTPPIRDTRVPDVPSGFFGSAIGGIFSAALKRLGNTLAGFGMGFFTMSIEFIDNVFASLGYPALVSTIFGWMDSLFASVPTLVGYGVTLIGQIFLLINTSAGNTLTQLTGIITIWVGMYSTTMDLLTGVLTPGINLWNDLGVNSFIQIGAILYPFWLIMMGMEKGTQAVFDHLNSVLNIGSFFLNFILNVGGFFMGLMDMLIGAIRG